MEENVIQVPVESIIPNRFQPRLQFDEEGLKELSESIRQHGIIQPLVLRRTGDKYEIIAGERRFKASQMAGLKTVPAVISNIDDNQSAEIALVENIQRRNLTAIEEAKSYKNLLDRGYMTQEQLATKLGISQSNIANKLRLLNLSNEVQQALLEEKISERHARSLLSLPKEEQNIWLDKIIQNRLTVRQLDLQLKKEKGDKMEDIPLVKNNQNIDNIINNAVDLNIPKEEKQPEIKEEPENKEPFIVPNKFFNFLEDEAVNMNMDIPDNNYNSRSIEENIETLDDLLSESISEPQNTQQPLEVQEQKIEEIVPTFDPLNPEPQTNNSFTFMNNQNNVNEIEEINTDTKPEIFDPMEAVIKLDPSFEEKQEEQQGLDLKTAITEIRELVDKLNSKGFNISIEELDLNDTYRVNIDIHNN